jgi:hypothetical protein
MPTVTPLLNYLPAGPGPRVPALKVNCIPHSVIQSWGVTPTRSLLLIKKARFKLDKNWQISVMVTFIFFTSAVWAGP